MRADHHVVAAPDIVRNIARFWNVRPMPSEAMSCTGVGRHRTALEQDVAAWYWYSRLRQLNRVVLPAPFGPIRPQTGLARTSKLTPSSATMPPNRTDTSRTLSSGEPRDEDGSAM
jgi:hypothetical protein